MRKSMFRSKNAKQTEEPTRETGPSVFRKELPLEKIPPPRGNRTAAEAETAKLETQKSEIGRTRKIANTLVEMAKKFSPVYIIGRLREDIRTVREAREISRSREPKSNRVDVISSRMDLKMVGALCLSEIVGTLFCAPSFGTMLQYLTGNAYMGVIGTIIGDYFPAVLSFQAAWLALNWEYYSKCTDTFLGKVKHFYKDILPLHGIALIASVPAYLSEMAVSSSVIAGINALTNGFAHKLPMPFISYTINFAVSETVFLTLVLGTSMDTLVKTIAGRYAEYLKKEEQKSG